MSVAQWFDELALSGTTRQLAQTLCRLTTYACEPELFRADVFADALRRVLIHGVVYVDGGWAQIIDALAQRALSQGALLQMDALVSRVQEREDHVHVELRHGGAPLHARHLVLATPPKAAAQLLGLEASDWGLVPARAACLDLVIRGRAPTPAQILGVKEPFYYAVTSRTASLTKNPDIEVLHAARYLPHTTKPTRHLAEQVLDGVLPDWRTRSLHARYCAMPVAYGIPIVQPSRPPIQHSARMCMVGDWVQTDYHMADAVAQSASMAAATLLERLLNPGHAA